MIKNLLGEEKEPKKEESKPAALAEEKNLSEVPEKKESSTEDLPPEKEASINSDSKTPNEKDDEIEAIEEIKNAIETGDLPEKKNQTVKPFEVNRPIGQPEMEKTAEKTPPPLSQLNEIPEKSNRELELEKKLAEIEAELLAEKESHKIISEEEKEAELETGKKKQQAEMEKQVKESADLEIKKSSETKTKDVGTEEKSKITVVQKDYKPESKGEIIRKTGLAWSAAIALFGSVIFMMVLGWFVDLLLGSSPWGITAGIILGGGIGFLQFFRLTSQIINPQPNDFEKVSLSSNLREAKPLVETGTGDENKNLNGEDDKKAEKKSSSETKNKKENNPEKESESGS